MTLSVVLAGVRGLANDYGQIPIRLVKQTDKGDVPAKDHRCYGLFERSPDGVTSPIQFKSAMILHRTLYGSAYLEIVNYGDGRTRLQLLNPRETRAELDAQNQLYYVNAGNHLPAEKVIHIAGVGFDGISGYNAINLCRQTLGLTQVLETYAAAFMKNGAKSSGVLKTSPAYTPEARKQLLDDWKEMTEGKGSQGSTAILPPDADYRQISVNPAAAQMLESRKFQIYEICRVIGIPPNRVGELDGYNYGAVESENLLYLQTTLGPIAEGVEQMLNLKLLTEQEQSDGLTFKHDFSILLKTDAATRTAMKVAMFDRGVISGNQWAISENYPAYDNGDRRYVPLNMGDANGGQDISTNS
ncbi:MAG: phage portal protein [Planctomycetales bacterium 71-10]|nr:MAG: phage portal protein [Planctomycetales bacterium 71-10]